MAEHARVVRVSTFAPADGRRDELVEVCASLADLARSADGCFGAQVCTVSERPDVIAVVSRWRDPSAAEAFTGPRTSDALGQLAGLLAGTPTTEHYVTQS